ncbi:MAG: hypothetical protein K0U34_00925 [Alphaproteobacteria bacterium]|nr:hypothetical protein [Alphaproteobacteria bacterium]
MQHRANPMFERVETCSDVEPTALTNQPFRLDRHYPAHARYLDLARLASPDPIRGLKPGHTPDLSPRRRSDLTGLELAVCAASGYHAVQIQGAPGAFQSGLSRRFCYLPSLFWVALPFGRNAHVS